VAVLFTSGIFFLGLKVQAFQKAKSKMSQPSSNNFGSGIALTVMNTWISLLESCTCIFQAFVSEGYGRTCL
jgi:hypothetical protein